MNLADERDLLGFVGALGDGRRFRNAEQQHQLLKFELGVWNQQAFRQGIERIEQRADLLRRGEDGKTVFPAEAGENLRAGHARVAHEFRWVCVQLRCVDAEAEPQIAVKGELHDRFRAGVQPVQREISHAEIQRQTRVAGVAHASGVAMVDFQQRRAGRIVMKDDGFCAVCVQRQLYAGIQRPDIQPPFILPADAGADGRRKEQRVRLGADEQLALGHIRKTRFQRLFPISRHKAAPFFIRWLYCIIFWADRPARRREPLQGVPRL